MEIIESNKIENITTEEVKEEELDEIIEIGEEMIKYCVENGGIGLAAPQVGIFKSFFVYSPKPDIFQIVINPKWARAENKKTNTVEGCLSYPNQNYYLERYKYISAIFYGKSKKTGKMEKITKRMSRDEAIIFQHEADHLIGKTISTEGKLLK
jgi:peptide deformylase